MSLDFFSSRAVILIAGRSGSGKSTFAIRYLLNAPGLSCRFIFDPRGEFSERLKLSAASTARELEEDLSRQTVIFCPHRMFPGRETDAFRFFCKWVFEVCGRGRGQKVFLVDEVWKYCSPQSIPIELAACVQEGRKVQLDMMFCTQRPNMLNESITNEVTEAICFALSGPNAIKAMEFQDVPADVSANLSNGEFFAVNRDTGGTLRGRVF